MAIYKTRWFDRWARKQGLSAALLRRAVDEMARGLIDAELGSGLFKKRVAPLGHGKSGGYRTLVATNRDDRWVFVFGFSKNVRGNIDQDEEEALKKLAVQLLKLPPDDIDRAVRAGELIEVNDDAKD